MIDGQATEPLAVEYREVNNLWDEFGSNEKNNKVEEQNNDSTNTKEAETRMAILVI